MIGSDIYLVVGIFQPLLKIPLLVIELVNCQEKSLKRFSQRLQLQVLLRLCDHRGRRHFASLSSRITGA